MKNYSLYLLTFIVLLTASLQAEQPRGRYDNGKAFRTDCEGVKISDQLAELEVRNRELEQQVAKLEDDYLEAQKKSATNNQFSGKSERVNSYVACPKVSCPEVVPAATIKQVECPKDRSAEVQQDYENQISRIKSSFESQVSELSAQVKHKESRVVELSQVVNELRGLAASKDANVLKYDNVLKEESEQKKLLTAKLIEKDREIEKLKVEFGGSQTRIEQDLKNSFRQSENEHKMEISKLELANKELKNSLHELEKQHSSSSNNSEYFKNTIEELQKDKLSLERELIRFKSEVASLNDNNQKLNDSLASKSTVVAEDKKVIINNLEEESEDRYSDNTEFVKKAREDISRIDNLIDVRKKYLDGLKSKSLGISLSVRPLKSTKGVSLDIIRLEVSKFSGRYKGSELIESLIEIEKVLNDDIQTLQRLSRIN